MSRYLTLLLLRRQYSRTGFVIDLTKQFEPLSRFAQRTNLFALRLYERCPCKYNETNTKFHEDLRTLLQLSEGEVCLDFLPLHGIASFFMQTRRC